MSFPKIRGICVLMVYTLCLTGLATARQDSSHARSNAAVNNQDIMRMTRAKFDDATIVKTIQAFDTDLDVSVTALVDLKEAGVTQPVIQAMLAKATAGGNAQPIERPKSPATPTRETLSTQKELSTNFVPMSHGYPVQDSLKSDETSKPVKGTLSRVYLESVSSGTNRNAARDQSMEMAM